MWKMALNTFKEHFDSAIRRWQSPFARISLQEAQQFEHSMSSDQHYRLQLAHGKIVTCRRESW